jgi:peptidoglycan hydrolase-like protein with peptidoglycan-binding domain
VTNLTKPVLTLTKKNPNPEYFTDAIWWLWEHLEALHPAAELGGIYANKKGFHNTGRKNQSTWPDNYSIRDKVNQSGPGWTHASALDWTFPDAQRGDYKNIDKFSSRLLASSLDPKDPRLDMALFEWFGQADSDAHVEGYNEYREEYESSDSSHLWHIHMSFKRTEANNLWGMWALLTVLMGWSVAKWRDSIPVRSGHPDPTPKPQPGDPNVPVHVNGAHEVREPHRGTDVVFVQRKVGAKPVDGVYGPSTAGKVAAWQRSRHLDDDGIVGPRTWDAMGY